ncbi:GNAT family N-acetyltransferase [Acinetobacter sp. YH12239]|uniref:GNAT family N-acetyltransferase n=1 Tax=Acinetobacter sp. YH12239 TaxID=2601166 RepID=UPI0015D2B248|nr:GNAT family N-acetyltransferase [Acinetobacter sp. YH12239]
MTEQNLLYRSKTSPEFYLRYAAEQDDPQLIELISESMPSNGMVISFERKPSYFRATHAQYNKPEILVVVHQDQPDLIIAMMNIGWKSYWINGVTEQLRYVSDLRIKLTARGKKAFNVFMEYIFECFPREIIFQSVILEDNKVARNMMHREREGYALPYIFDSMTTFTISKVPKFKQSAELRLQTMTIDKIDAVNGFIQEMASHYNFLPDYDFKVLLEANHPFWYGLRLEDFHLVLNSDHKIVGLFGLWDQKDFKQTKVASYSTTLKLLKPVYNTYARITGQLTLPEEGQSFDYLMTHSFLCDPSALDVLKFMLTNVNTLVKAQGKTSFCVTVVENDPRKQVLEQCSSHKMKAVHTLHSYESKPYDVIDRSKYSYFEVSRI